MSCRTKVSLRQVTIAGAATVALATAISCEGGPAAVTEAGRPAALGLAVSAGDTTDSATTQYRTARLALSGGDTATAFRGLDLVIERWPQSARGPAAMYWKAFALYRRGGTENMLVARNLLRLATQIAPSSYALGDASMLLLRVQHRLAMAGDAEALRELEIPTVAALTACEDGASAGRLTWASDPAQSLGTRLDRLATLTTTQGQCTALLRQQALLLLARMPNEGGLAAILAAAEHDPSPAVRRQGVRSIPHPAPDAARQLLEAVLRSSDDLTSVEAAAAAWAGRPDWGTGALEAYVARADRNATATHYIEGLLAQRRR